MPEGGNDASGNKSRLVLCTVGISLIDKLRVNGGLNLPMVHSWATGDLQTANNPPAVAKLETPKFAYEKHEEIIGILNKVWGVNNLNNTSEEVLTSKIEEARRASPAELASLHDLLKKSDGYEIDSQYDNRIVFLCSDTDLGAFCARCLMGFVSSEANGRGRWASCDNIHTSEDLRNDGTEDGVIENLIDKGGLVIVKGLGIGEEGRFREEGLGSLVDVLSQIIKHAKESEIDVNVVATGGFKPESVYAAVVGALSEVDVYYLHEQSMSNLKLPVFPIDHDVNAWAEYKDIIKAIDGQPEAASMGLLESLPEQIKRLFEEREQNLALNPFGRLTLGQMERRLPALSRYGQGLLLSEYISDEVLREKLRQNVRERWRYIWLGDRIPETVEHARGHAQRLLALATQLLVPIFEESREFLSSEELFVLLSAIWLHDIGHGATMLTLPDGRKKDISRFSTIVRDLHHYLSLCMLTCDGAEDYGLGEYGDIVARVCLYHRGKMPIKDEDDAFKEKASDIAIFGPIDESMSVNGKTIRARFLASLLRIIDACDVQEERTVDEGHVIWRRALTESEIDAERERLERLYGIIAEMNKPNDELCKCLAEMKKRIEEYTGKVKELANYCENCYKNQGASENKSEDGSESGEGSEEFMKIYAEYDACLKDLQKKLRKTINQIWALDNTGGSDRSSLLLLEAWAESASRVIFKADQDVHFLKHSQVRQVAFVPCEGFGENEKYKFKIKIWPKKQNIEPWLEMISAEIKEERDRIRENIVPIEICDPEIEGS